MAFFSWDPKFEVGILQIDTQHKRLVGLVDEMYEAMSQRQGTEVLGKVLNELAAYTVVHFRAEEELMAKHAYPGLDEHRAKHESMTKRVVQLKSEFEAGKASVMTSKVGTFLKDWLTKHIQGTDMKYAPYLKDKGVS